MGAVAGYQWILDSGLNFNAGVGVQYAAGPSTFTTSTAQTANVPTQATDFSPVLEVSVGYAFK
jgi:hypothetical protein